MDDYPFQLVSSRRNSPLKDKSVLLRRPFTRFASSFAENARLFVPGDELEDAINTAIAVGEPLLITGEPGTGKTQAAYYAAYNLGIEPVSHFQVKSDSVARDLLYHFDTVRYFHDANLHKESALPEKSHYVEKRHLWEAMESEFPRILLIDEIDKAPRDFPNDLLHELDTMEFYIPETRQMISAPKEKRPMVFITTNSERRLPAPFLRRCVYHHIEFSIAILEKAVKKRKAAYENLSPEFIKTAMSRFLALREKTLRKPPATGEFLVWLRVLALRVNTYPEHLDRDLSRLPYIGVLLKDHQDIADLKRDGRF
jgi:MoxR-like ATPase